MKILSLFIVFLTFILAGASLVLAHSGDDYFGHHSMMGGFYGGMFGMSFFGWIFMILVIVALVLLIIWLIRQLEGSGKRRS